MENQAAASGVDRLLASDDNEFEQLREQLARLEEKRKARREVAALIRKHGVPLIDELVNAAKQDMKAGRPLSPPEPEAKASGPAGQEADDELPGAREAIMNWLKEHPGGGLAREIANALHGRFRTTSDNPDNVIMTSVSDLARADKVDAINTGGPFKLYRLRQSDQAGPFRDFFDDGDG